MLSSIIPTILRQERSLDTCHQAWPCPQVCTCKQQQGQQSSHYEQHGHGARMHVEGARQPVFRHCNGQDRPQDCCCCCNCIPTGNEDPYDNDPETEYHFSYFVQDRHEARIMQLKARLAYACALRAASAMEYCDYLLSSGMMTHFPDISSLQPTFTWTGGEDTPEFLLQTAGGHCHAGQPCHHRQR